MRPFQSCATLALAFAAATPAVANDSTASFATGGLVLTRTDAIAMKSEDLSVSADAIQVAYVFRNTSDKPVTTTVAFPVPDVTALPYIDISIPNDDPANPLGFETRVEGRPVTMKLDQKATLDGRDVTRVFSGLGVPLAPQDERAGDALDALPRANQDELIAAGLAELGDPEAADSRQRNLQALWSWSGTYHWEQTFEPGRDLHIEHRYTPSVGSSVATVLDMEADYPDEVKECGSATASTTPSCGR